MQLNAFIDYFEKTHVGQILQLHLGIILQKRQAFVGTKTLCGALKTVQIGLKYSQTRKMIEQHINVILYEISLPLMLVSQNEFDLWQENSIEYVRMQMDESNPFNSKILVRNLVKQITGIRKSRKVKVGEYLQNYLQILAQNLEATSPDFRIKEAVLHSLGSLQDHVSLSLEL
jgi:hypothetical protein